MSVAETALAGLLDHLGLQGGGSRVAFSSVDPVVPGRHALGAANAAALAAYGLGVAHIWEQRGGAPQQLQLDLRRAAWPGLCTFMHIQQNGHQVPSRWDPAAANFFPTRDGRRFYLFYAPAYQRHSLRLLSFMGATTEAASLAARVAAWNGFELEDALADAGLMGCVARTRQEWLDHPQGRWLSARGPVEVLRLGDAPRQPWRGDAHRPLAGLRVLDMSHVLAGPLVSRLLAEQGAEVLHVAAPHQPDGHLVDLDTGLGKRRAFIDLDRPGDLERLLELVDQADVFVQSWRPGALARRGLGAEALARRRPGLVYVSLSCWGDEGPWARRGGYEPLAQAGTGYAIAEGSAEQPALASTATLNDYLAASLAAAGVVAALQRRQAEGGSHHVRSSLAQSSMWVQSLGLLDAAQAAAVRTLPEVPVDDFEMRPSVYGTLRHPRPLIDFSHTPAGWDLPPQPPGASPAAWAA